MSFDMGHDDMVGFARVMWETTWQYGSFEGGERMLEFFAALHKFDAEYQKWREFGGGLDQDCLDKFGHWYDHRNDVEDEDDE